MRPGLFMVADGVAAAPTGRWQPPGGGVAPDIRGPASHADDGADEEGAAAQAGRWARRHRILNDFARATTDNRVAGAIIAGGRWLFQDPRLARTPRG